MCSLAETTSGNPAEDVFGKNFVLTVDPTSGTLSYNFSSINKQLESIIATKDVRLVSDKMDLRCDRFTFDMNLRKIQATGKPIKIIQGPIDALCGEFSYDPSTGRSELLYSPEIINRDPIGQEISTKGDKMIIEKQKNGDTMVMVEGKARLSSKISKDNQTSPPPSPDPSRKVPGLDLSIVTGEKGEILYTFTGKNELRSIVARNDVSISSQEVELTCARLEYESETKKMIASGKPVKIVQKNILAECGRLEYYPDEGKYLLLEDPSIINNNEEGVTMQTRGEKIFILQAKEGLTSVLVEGHPQIIGESGKKEDIAKKQTKEPPFPVDESRVNQIKNPDIIQE